MIYSVNGTVDLIEPNLAVIDCGGVGYACRTTANTLSQLKIGELLQDADFRFRCRTKSGTVDIIGNDTTGIRTLRCVR